MARGVECVGVIFDEITNDPVFKMQCDCGTLTELQARDLSLPENDGDALEFAYTCDGCVSSHWMTIKRLRELPHDL